MRIIPKYRHHRASGLAVVSLYGRDVYLGKYGTPESRANYLAQIAEWQANDGETPIDATTLEELTGRYLKHAERHYRKNGQPTPTLAIARSVCAALLDMYPGKLAAKFGIAQFKAMRHRWAVGSGDKRGVCRKTANQYADRLREVFRWGTEEGLVPVEVLQAIRAVKPLARGRSVARETASVKPVDIADVDAVRPFLHRRVVAKVDLQLLTGMRPGEVCSIRTCDLDRSGSVWVYTPSRHKTEHHDKARTVPLGPRAQAILAEFLDDADPERPVLVRGHSGRQFFEGMPEPKGLVSSYRKSISIAAGKAGIEPWHPNQLRHNAATEVRKRYGIEIAQLMLGHSSANTTEIYAEKNLDAVSRIAAEIG